MEELDVKQIVKYVYLSGCAIIGTFSLLNKLYITSNKLGGSLPIGNSNNI